MASGTITSWQIDGETMETVRDFIFGSSKITADGDCSHEIKRHLVLGRKGKGRKGWCTINLLLQSCPTLCDPTDGQPTRLPRPWDSPGKNSGVGCHFLLQCMKVKSESEVAQSYLTLRDPMDCSPPGSSIHGTLKARVLEWGAIAFSMINLDSILKSRDITLPTKVCLVKALVFPVIIYGCESWTMKKAEH